MKSRIATLLVLVCFAFFSRAAVTLPPVIGSNMILQQGRHTVLWGWADAGEKVTVKLGDQVVATVEGKGTNTPWQVTLPKLKAGAIADITIAGSNTVTLTNLAAGEVWLCSGQSNMAMTFSKGKWCRYGGILNEAQEIAAATNGQIRVFTVGGGDMSSKSKVDQWACMSPAVAPQVSAMAYFFGRELQAKLKVPVGLVISSVGGTAVELWTPASVLENDPEFQAALKAAEPVYKELHPLTLEDQHAQKLYNAAVEEAKAKGDPKPEKPALKLSPADSGRSEDAASIVEHSKHYNNKIQPLVPMTFAGVIWYQGESNARRSAGYAHSLTLMIEGWRAAFGQKFPFIEMQLASYKDSNIGIFHNIREAQAKVAETVPNVWMATAVDIGMSNNIHPINKQEAGRRAALLALDEVYEREIVSSGPKFAEASFENGRAIVKLKGDVHGLTLKGTGGFEVAGEDRQFVPATAVIAGKKLEITSPKVAKPVAVRYAWSETPECTLYNDAGLPALPFRSDAW